MSDDMETVDALEHTHEDGVTHSHEGGDQEHTHTEVPAFNLADFKLTILLDSSSKPKFASIDEDLYSRTLIFIFSNPNSLLILLCSISTELNN